MKIRCDNNYDRIRDRYYTGSDYLLLEQYYASEYP